MATHSGSTSRQVEVAMVRVVLGLGLTTIRTDT